MSHPAPIIRKTACHLKHVAVAFEEIDVNLGLHPRKYRALKNFHFSKWKFFFYSILRFFQLFFEEDYKKAMGYSIASSSNLTIRFTFAVNAVKYICKRIANKPLESALRKP